MRKGKQIPVSSRSLASGWASQPGAWGIPTGGLGHSDRGSHRARAQSAVADGARARNRALRVHGINATFFTAHKPPFPNWRIMLLISIILSITKFLPEQRFVQDGMIQSHGRLSTSTSTSTTKNQNKTMHRSDRSTALNFRNSFGGHSVMIDVRT